MTSLAVAATLSTVGASGLGAQFRGGVETGRMMREAASLEARGDLEGAESLLRRVLEEDPTAAGAVFSIERVLRAGGEPVTILPTVDAFLARDPTAAQMWALKLRILVEADSVDAVRREASRWIAAVPGEGAYRELAAAFEKALGPADAVALILEGRGLLGDEDMLALELGDLKARMGDIDAAVAEWSIGIGDDGMQVAPVARRLRDLDEGGDRASTLVLAALTASPVFARRRAAALLAVELRLEEEALETAGAVSAELGGRARATFLGEVGERAGALGMTAVASWAYDQLGEEAQTPAERRAFDQRLVEVALAAGDTVAAAEAQTRIASSHPEGSSDRRQAGVQALRLGIVALPGSDLRPSFDAFAEEYPAAPEIDELAAAVSRRLRVDGDPAGALAVLSRATGPRSSIERGYLLLAEGRIPEGRDVLMGAVEAVSPSEATETIRLVGLLGRLSPTGAALLGRATATAHHGRLEEALALLVEGDLSAPSERAELLAHAARLAEDAGAVARAVALRETLLSEYPEDPGVPEAALDLARHHATQGPEGRERAIRILEEMIASTPNAAVAPTARAELARLRSEG
jgi:tetratricopeptide (TPR) repeat protein